TEMESCSSPSCLWTGVEQYPSMNTPVKIVNMLDPHIISASITKLHITAFAGTQCTDQPGGSLTYPPSNDQLVLQVNPNPDGSIWCLANSDSGSPIPEASTGKIVGILNWMDDNPNCYERKGGGTDAPRIRTTLGFDSRYGPNTTDLSVSLWPTAFSAVTAG